MAVENEVAASLQYQICKVNASLVDDVDLSAPSYYRPVWPETGLEAVIDDIQAKRSQIEKHVTGTDGEFLKAQYRAVDYLYGSGVGAVDGKVANPLVDIVCLLSTIGEPKRASSSFRFTTEGSPVAHPYLAKPNRPLKPEQRTILEDESGNKQEARSISRFKDHITTVLRGLFVLAEASKHSPLVIETTLNDFSQKFAGGRQEIAGNALGILEILHTLGLTYDSRFFPLADQLRTEVLASVKDYPELKQKFSYTVVSDRSFWYQGESQLLGRKKTSYLKSQEPSEPILRKSIKLEAPLIENWQSVSRKRQEIGRSLKGLTVFNSVKAEAVGFSEEKAINRVLKDRLKKADLTEQMRSLERKEAGRLKEIWRTFIEAEVNEETTFGKAEEKLVGQGVKAILRFFTKDESLSQKAKTNIGTLEKGDAETYYNIEVAKLGKDPLFSWILALRNPYIREAFAKAISQNESSQTSFYLLLKVMAFDVLKKSLGKKEMSFLFDPNYPQKVNTKALLETYAEIESAAKLYVPDITEISKDALALGDSKIEDLISPESIKRYQLKLENLTYKKILDLFWKDKSKAFTEEDKKKVRKIAKGIICSGLLAIFQTLAITGITAASDFFRGMTEQERFRSEAQANEQLRLLIEAQQANEQGAAQLLAVRETARIAIERLREQETNPDTFRQADEPTRRVAEISRIPGEIGDRIPDAIRNERDGPLSESQRFGLTSFGRIYHLPETMSSLDGATIGYFPWDINMQEFLWSDIDTRVVYQLGELQPLEDTAIVESIDALRLDFAPNQLAYSSNGVNAEMYPPIGYRFVSVYQEGGKTPMLGPLGELYYGYDNMENFPSRALFVLEPVELTNLGSRVRVSEAERETYFPWIHPNATHDLTRALSADPVLWNIYGNFIREVTELERSLYNIGQSYTYDDYLREYSEVGIRYAQEYARYTSENRFYALGFRIEELAGNDWGWDSLISLANQPENGYFCSVAAFAFRDFMTSAGFLAGNQPGVTLFNYQGYLWGGMGHMNNVVFLPDGRILEVDMTPGVTEDTPQSDLDFLRGRIVTPEDITRAIEDANTSGLQVIEDEDAVRRMVSERERVRRITENPTYVSDEDFNTGLEEIGSLAEEMLSREIARRGQETADVDSITQSSESYAALRWIIINAERIGEDSPSLLDIQIGRSNPDEVYSEYRNLEQIIASAASLRENATQEDLAAIGQIIYRAEGLKNDLETLTRGQIVRGRQNAELLDQIQREYRRYYERTGRYPGEISQDERFDQAEWLRTRNAFLDLTPISDADLQYFDEEFLERVKHDLEMFINEMVPRTSENKTARSPRSNLPAGLPLSHEYSTYFTNASNIGQLIANRPELYETLEESTREELEQLPSLMWELQSMFAGTTELTEEQQLVRAQQILSRVRRVDEAIEQFRFPPEAQPEENGDPVLTSQQWEHIVKLSGRLGVGAAVLAFAYLGLRLYKSEKSRKEELKRIEESLKTNKNFSKTEKDIVLSTVGHICHLAYERDFPQKAAAIINLLGQYKPQRHESAIDWLRNDGADIILADSIEDSYYHLAELVNGKARGTSAQEIMRYFPEVITRGLKRINTHPEDEKGISPDLGSVEVPHEYQVIYGLSRLLLNNSILSLHDEVIKRLGVSANKKANSIPYKIDDFRDLLREKYADGSIPQEAKPLVNTILFILWNTQETPESVIVS